MNRLRTRGRSGPALLAMMGALALVLVTSAVSYGFVWRAEYREREEFRTMIYNISKAMGETEACNE